MRALDLNSQRYNACIGYKQSALQCLFCLQTVSVTLRALALVSQCYNAYIGSKQSALQCLYWL